MANSTHEDPTMLVESGGPARRSADAGQFAPGTIVAGRYRIASVLGAGGMGEVYRAEDVKLGQTVALKFLPARFARDQVLLMQLHDEVRIGRQVAHPNVCRIYDIGEWGDAHFVAMEYVDGEDLARLLRRIGRLPQDKAIEIARGIAAGIAAAHAKGIIHRDLKPANVMIDSRGDARITDFGLALAAEEADGAIAAGTPAYMAPEQLEGKPASVESDIFALGLVMYETFTGRRPYLGQTLPELRREHASEVRVPSSVIRDLDPAVECIILRCLHRDPAERPHSVREVLQALPGGLDPLAAAVAAGETPSPRVVAAAGSEGSLSRAAAWSCVGIIVMLIAALLAMSASNAGMLTAGLTKPPVVMEERASDVLQSLGIAAQPRHAIGFEGQVRYIAWLVDRLQGRDRFRRLRAGPPWVTFWMRQSAAPLTPKGNIPSPTLDDPPLAGSSMTTIELDPRGRLVSLTSTVVAEASRAPDWHTLLAAAGFDVAKLKPVPPRRAPPIFADTRAAWTGEHPDDGTPVRIEAAALNGVPVFFRLSGPWDEIPSRQNMRFNSPALFSLLGAIVVTVVLAGIVLALRNLRARRGDRPGTLRLGIVVFLLRLGSFLMEADHQLDLRHELALIQSALQLALFMAALYIVLYAALEPYVRRRWPERLISWSRLIGGNVRNPMVGRDVLVGVAAGLGHASLGMAAYWLPPRIANVNQALPHIPDLDLLRGFRYELAHFGNAAGNGMFEGLLSVVLLVLLSMVLRRRTAAVAALFLLQVAVYLVAVHDPTVVPFTTLVAALVTLVIVRYGLLTMVVTEGVFLAMYPYPLAVLPGGWNGPYIAFALLAVAALTWFAFRTALGSQSPLGFSLDEG